MFKDLQELKDSLIERGYEDSIVLEIPDFIDAVVGISQNEQVIYDFEKMVEHLVIKENMTEDEAVEFIEYNTINALPYMGDKRPIIMYKI